MTVYVGTSGWQYKDWRGRFYPRELAHRDWLEHFSQRFSAVEVNNTFYRLPERSAFENWAARTPDDFVVACKLSRYLTHVKRLKDPAEPVRRFLDRSSGLGEKRGPLLLQLPPNLKRDDERLDDALAAFPDDVRIAVEFRHDTWFDDEVYDLLERHDAALCLADRDSRRVGPVQRTARWGYLRLHGGRASPSPCYGRSALAHWAERIAQRWGPRQDVFVFLNNDTAGCAVRDAVRFAHYVEKSGRKATRVPEPREVSVG